MEVQTISDVLSVRDTINSKEAKAFATINGQNIPLIELKELSAKFEKNKEEVQAIGSRITKNKPTSMKGTGTLSGYLINSNWVKYGLDFARGKSDLYFDITATIEDTTSRTGKQTILLKDVNLDEIPVLNLNSDDGVLDWETDFTFDDAQLVNAFVGVNSAE